MSEDARIERHVGRAMGFISTRARNRLHEDCRRQGLPVHLALEAYFDVQETVDNLLPDPLDPGDTEAMSLDQVIETLFG